MDSEIFTDVTLDKAMDDAMTEVQRRMEELCVSSEHLAKLTGMKEQTIQKFVFLKVVWPNMKQYIIILEALGMQMGKPVPKT